MNFIRYVISRIVAIFKRVFLRKLNTDLYFVAQFLNGSIVKGNKMSIIVRNDQQVTLSPTFTDAKGNVVSELGSIPTWTVSDPSIAGLAISEDGMSVVVTGGSALGTAQINMVVDADPDSDIEEITGVVDITFKSGKAVFVSLSSQVADAEVGIQEQLTGEQTVDSTVSEVGAVETVSVSVDGVGIESAGETFGEAAQ
jgi:hypothetical protein